LFDLGLLIQENCEIDPMKTTLVCSPYSIRMAAEAGMAAAAVAYSVNTYTNLVVRIYGN
jgi:hypothetical protein